MTREEFDVEKAKKHINVGDNIVAAVLGFGYVEGVVYEILDDNSNGDVVYFFNITWPNHLIRNRKEPLRESVMLSEEEEHVWITKKN